ncbi:MAG TPA: hypothetical protein PK668_00395 [Myxococcota bacterium]|nr:hypothetical protein [Myxococcota bacterium]HRY95710.1 hypothetical protein [Myxococcota bacterium]
MTRRRAWPLAMLAALLLIAGLVAAVLLHRPAGPGDAPRPTAPDGPPEAGPPVQDLAPIARAADGGPQSPAPADAPPARAAGREEIAFQSAWGSQPGQLGRNPAQESNPEGPMSLVVDGDGRILVLDQVNMRVQVFEDGKASRTVPLPNDTIQELALDKDGDLLLMDRLAEQSVLEVDASGKIKNEVALVGAGVPEGGGVTGMFWREDGLWVEVEHRYLVRIMDAAGNPDPTRPILEGRLSADGQFLLHAALEGPFSVVVLARPMAEQGELRALARVALPLQVLQILSLDTDMLGRIYLACHLVRWRAVDPFDAEEEAVLMVVLGPDGGELGRIPMHVSQTPDEQMRSIFVTPDGVIYQLVFTEQGAIAYRYTL